MKLFRSVAALSLVLGCYATYMRLFPFVIMQFAEAHTASEFQFVTRSSHSKRISIDIARAAMGVDHWSTASDLGYRYYNAERGYWIYAREAHRIIEEDGVRYDGKRIRLRPFLMIMKSYDGKNTRTVTADVAVIDLNAPLSFSVSSDGEPLKIQHVHLEPNAQVHDDNNTPANPEDDMTTNQMTTLDYDEATRQIRTDSHVVMRDPERVASGDGMVIQLRKDEVPRAPALSSGFAQAERIDFNKNVHVVLRDVGESGFTPGVAVPRPSSKKTVGDARKSSDTIAQPANQASPEQPTPLDLKCDGKMQVFLPRPQQPVVVGPPELPTPTLAQFERNVVVLRGKIDNRPDQLTCDTLKLNLVPSDKPVEPTATAPAAPSQSSGSAPASGATQRTGSFGNLTLRRAHATGHVVWLSLPASGIKLRCNELIHLKLAPYKPDKTYLRGDFTRPLELVKVDIAEKEADVGQGKTTSVTHVRTIDATIYVRGDNTDAADVVATGPGRLETRRGTNHPVERIAIWQDKLHVQNEMGPEGQVLRKVITLTGKRPCFIDQAKRSSLDSAHLIRVWLTPAPKPSSGSRQEASSSSSLAGVSSRGSQGQSVLRGGQARSPSLTPDASHTAKASGQPRSSPELAGGSFEIERLLALRDVHLLAPAESMTARERLDAEFVKPVPSSVAPVNQTSTGTATSSSATSTASTSNGVTMASNSTAANPQQAEEPDAVAAQTHEQSPSQPDKPPSEPAMIGFAERMWMKLEMIPVKNNGEGPQPKGSGMATATSMVTVSTEQAPTDANAEIRNAWLWGSVSLHQDPAEGKTKGQDASGEAVYVDNHGDGNVISYVYQREPNERTYLPGPLPPARVENEDKTIEAAGVIKMNQGTDQAWVEGPGTLTQRTERASGIVSVPPPPFSGVGSPLAAVPPAGTAPAAANGANLAVTATPTISGRGSGSPPSSTSLVTHTDGSSKTSEFSGERSSSKPKTRAGRPLSKIVTTTIHFSEGMEFTGRTTDLAGHTAACGDFHGVVTALMEDALLHCEERMITYTDQAVPLAQLGVMSKPQSRTKPRTGDASAGAGTCSSPEVEQPQPQLALIECYRNAVLINRDVDPNRPILLQKKRVEADEVLFYDKRTGDFTIPGKGQVYLYDRSDSSTKTNAKGKPSSPRSRNSTESKAEEIPSLVLTQITFIKGMRSRPGTGGEEDKRRAHWYEFFGDIQLGRATVPDGQSKLNFDSLPAAAVFLTGQTLRFITEPPLVGSPPSAPARDYGKVWERAFFRNIDEAFLNDTVTADVITYDSGKDLIYAYGEGGRGVTYAQQHAAGQPASSGTARALRFYPKSGSMDFIDNTSIQMIDKTTGVRPVRAEAIDPDIKPNKPPKRGFRIPSNNMERRGFTGQ